MANRGEMVNHDALIDKAFNAIPWIIGGYIVYTIVKNSIGRAEIGGP